MQLDSTVVRSGLSHTDPIVREICRFCVKEKGIQFRARSEDVFNTYDKFGFAEIAHIEMQVCDEQLLDWILKQSARDFGEAKFVDYSPHIVWNWIENAELSLIRSRLSDIRDAVAQWNGRHSSEYKQQKIVPSLEARLAAMDLGPDECWRLVLDKSRWLDRIPYESISHADYWAVVREMELYLECAATPQFASEAIKLLHEDKKLEAKIEVAAMIQIATKLRLEEVAPKLIELLAVDFDYYNELIADYVKANCSEKMQSLIGDAMPELEWHERLFLHSVFEADHSESAANHLRALLEYNLEEQDGDSIDFLAQALSMQFRADDLDFLDDLYRKDNLNPEIIQVAETLHTCSVLGSLDDPRDSVWRNAKQTAYENHMREQKRRLDEIARDRRTRAEREKYISNQHSASSTIRIPTLERVGRNDPCPCGSGKKHKKCCARNQEKA